MISVKPFCKLRKDSSKLLWWFLQLIQFLVTMVGNRPVRSMKRKMPLMLNDASQLGQAPPKAPKLERTLSIEAGQQPTAYSVQSVSQVLLFSVQAVQIKSLCLP